MLHTSRSRAIRLGVRDLLAALRHSVDNGNWPQDSSPGCEVLGNDPDIEPIGYEFVIEGPAKYHARGRDLECSGFVTTHTRHRLMGHETYYRAGVDRIWLHPMSNFDRPVVGGEHGAPLRDDNAHIDYAAAAPVMPVEEFGSANEAVAYAAESLKHCRGTQLASSSTGRTFPNAWARAQEEWNSFDRTLTNELGARE